jgi:hypothetical protein
MKNGYLSVNVPSKEEGIMSRKKQQKNEMRIP